MKRFNKKILTAAALSLALLPAFAQKSQGNVLDLKYSIKDSEIVYPESFETDTQKLLERWYLKNYTSADLDATSPYDPGATDDQIRQRLAALPTVIEMPFNDIVKSYIERYTKKGRKQVTALLGLSSYYMPIFEQALEENGLPLELKYLPVIESGLNPNAVSKHGAAGLWQFIMATAKGYDMEVNSLVDERRDPYVSSEKACQMLKDLYNSYGDWSLAIAAYNCGPGTVNKALNRAGGDPSSHDFWSIYYYLPAETRGYVPAFIAANYVMEYYPEHDISPVLATKPLITDSIHLSQRVHFNQIASVLDIPVEELRILNPQFRADIIPASPSRPYNLILPSQQVHAFIVSQNQIFDFERDKYARKMDATPGGDPNATPVDMADGEPLNPSEESLIAGAETVYEEVQEAENTRPTTPRHRRNQSSVQDNNSVAPTQTETAAATTTKKSETTTKKSETTTKKSETTTKKQSTSSKSNSNTASTGSSNTKKKTTSTTSKAKTHTVSEGESLDRIAKKNGVTVNELKKANPNIKSDLIHPGDKINIPSKSSSKSSSSSKSTTKKKKKKK